ncbi:MAG: 4Fe-4S dicluster domain-containing protein [Parcubacteria group bacterium]|nr:4Fe-4S dicluster domain-containing protein [Parcubacteria group bacterium]
MKKIIQQIFNEIKGEYQVFGAQKIDDDLLIQEIEDAKSIYIGKGVPRNSFKQVFYPSEEKILEFEGNKIKENFDSSKRAIFGARFFDLKAVALYDEVFKDDIYYKKRRSQLFILGADQSVKKINDRKEFIIEELKYIPFDIFLNGNTVFARAGKGEKILKKLKIKYKIIEQVKETSPRDKEGAEMMRNLFKDKENHKLWKELGKICIACGKCTIACPTCFCFDFNDDVGPQKSCRKRIWGNCFYQDFTKIAGGYIFKDKVADRIKFWYFHKFWRIPRDYKRVGCVSCGRCTDVCPVGIKLVKNIESLRK